MTHKLIPFDPVPFFLAIAGLAIVVNLLVLLVLLLKTLEPDLVAKVKNMARAENKKRGDRPFDLPRASISEAYEMDVEVGSTTATARPPKRHGAEDGEETGT